MNAPVLLLVLLASASAARADLVTDCDPYSPDARDSCRPSRKAFADPREVRQPVQRSEVSLDTRPDRAPDDRSRFELLVSSWVPRDATTATYMTPDSGYRASSAPYLAASYLFSPFEGPLTEVSLKGGIGYLQLGRSRSMAVIGGAPETFDQTLSLLQFPLGAEWSPSFAQWKRIAPFLGAALVPTLGIEPESALGGGGTSFYLPVQFSTGVGFGLPGASGLAFRVGGLSSVGHVSESRAVGFGAFGGIVAGI